MIDAVLDCDEQRLIARKVRAGNTRTSSRMLRSRCSAHSSIARFMLQALGIVTDALPGVPREAVEGRVSRVTLLVLPKLVSWLIKINNL